MLIERCRQLHAENMEMNKAAEALSSRLQVNTASTFYYWCTFKGSLGPGSADSCHTVTLTSCQNSILHSHRIEGDVSSEK